MTLYQKVLAELTPASVAEIEERAAICEYDGGLARPVAEAFALCTTVDGGRAIRWNPKKETLRRAQGENLPGLERPATPPH